MRRISIGLGWQNRAGIDEFVQQAHVADDSGVWAIFTGENWRREAFAPLAVLARETRQAQLGTAIVNIWSRSAATLAEHFATLDELSEGRMIIGLGASSANVSEDFAGVPYEKPMRRMREYIEIINLLVSGAPLQHEGQIFRLQRGFKLDMDLPRNRIPVYIAATNWRSVLQTAEIADGWMPVEIPRSEWKAQARAFYDHAAEFGRDPSTLTVRSPSTVTVTHEDPEPEYERVRGTVAFYISRMGDGYYNQFVRMGYGEMADAVRAAWNEGGATAGAAAVPSEFARQMAFAGPAEACVEFMDAAEEDGVNLHAVSIAERDPKQRASIYRTLVG